MKNMVNKIYNRKFIEVKNNICDKYHEEILRDIQNITNIDVETETVLQLITGTLDTGPTFQVLFLL